MRLTRQGEKDCVRPSYARVIAYQTGNIFGVVDLLRVNVRHGERSLLTEASSLVIKLNTLA